MNLFAILFNAMNMVWTMHMHEKNRLPYTICFYWDGEQKKIVIKKKKTTAKKIEGNITLDFAGGRDTYISGDYELKHENGLSRKCELNTNVTNAKGFILSRLSHLNGGIAFVIAAPFLSVPFLLLTLTYLILLPPSLDAIWYEINLVLNDTLIQIQ